MSNPLPEDEDMARNARWDSWAVKHQLKTRVYVYDKRTDSWHPWRSEFVRLRNITRRIRKLGIPATIEMCDGCNEMVVVVR